MNQNEAKVVEYECSINKLALIHMLTKTRNTKMVYPDSFESDYVQIVSHQLVSISYNHRKSSGCIKYLTNLY